VWTSVTMLGKLQLTLACSVVFMLLGAMVSTPSCVPMLAKLSLAQDFASLRLFIVPDRLSWVNSSAI
jgi:hypothetical protein